MAEKYFDLFAEVSQPKFVANKSRASFFIEVFLLYATFLIETFAGLKMI